MADEWEVVEDPWEVDDEWEVDAPPKPKSVQDIVLPSLQQPDWKEQFLRRIASIRENAATSFGVGAESVTDMPKAAAKAGLETLGLTTFPIENLARITMRDGLYAGPHPNMITPKEQLRRATERPKVTTQEVLSSAEGFRPTTGSPVADTMLDIGVSAPISWGYPLAKGVVKGVGKVKSLIETSKAEALAKRLAGIEDVTTSYRGKGEIASLPSKPPSEDIPIGELGSEIRGDSAMLQAQSQLGPQASLIPRQILRPTTPQVRGAEQMGVQSLLAPSKVLEEAPVDATKPILDRIERAEQSIKAIDTQLENTKNASKITGINDTRTVNLLTRAKDEQLRIIKNGKDELKLMKDNARVKQSPFAPPEPSAPDPTFLQEKKESIKEIFSKGMPGLRSSDMYLESKGYPQIVEPIRDAIYNKEMFISKYVGDFRKLQSEFKLDAERGEKVARLLNGEKVAGATPDLEEAARQIRRQVFDPIHKEISSDPQLAQLIGPVGYIKDYFPHMEASWMSKLGDADLVRTMVHDIKPAGLKAKFWETRKWDDPNFNRSLEDVVTAYVNGSAKTKFDLTAYDRANRAAELITDATHKKVASKYLRDYMGQPSAQASVYQEVPRMIEKGYYNIMIGGNPISAALNLTQTYLNTATRAGYNNTSKAIKHVFGNWKDAYAEAKAAGVLEGYPEISEGTISKIKEDFSKKGFGSVANDFLFSAFKSSEQFNRVVAYFAGKSKYYADAPKKSKNLSEFAIKDGKKVWIGGSDAEEKARRAGWDMARETQFLYGKASPIPYAQIPLLGQFSSYPLKQAEFIFNTMTKGDKGQKARLLAQYGSAAAALAAYDQWSGDKAPSISSLMGDMNPAVAGLPIPGVGPAVKDFSDLLKYMYKLEQGQASIEDFPEKALKQLALHTPLLRQLIRYSKSED